MLDGATPNQRLKARRKLEGSANPSAKAVAYDVYETLCGRYWLRIAGLVWGSLHVGFMSRRAYRAMLQQDGVWNTVKGRIRIWIMVGHFFKNAGGAMLRALRLGYHPNQIADPPWVDQWRLASQPCTAISCRCSILANAIYRQGSRSSACLLKHPEVRALARQKFKTLIV